MISQFFFFIFANKVISRIILVQKFCKQMISRNFLSIPFQKYVSFVICYRMNFANTVISHNFYHFSLSKWFHEIFLLCKILQIKRFQAIFTVSLNQSDFTRFFLLCKVLQRKWFHAIFTISLYQSNFTNFFTSSPSLSYKIFEKSQYLWKKETVRNYCNFRNSMDSSIFIITKDQCSV